MRHLPQEERDTIDRMTREISRMPILAGHRHRFIEKLGHTIGGDYYKNREAAEQEFTIAIWRALVYLLHHTDYSYRCEACNATEYTTHKNKPKALDRRYPICPACSNVRITDPGDSDLTAGQFIHMDDLQRTILALGGNNPPKHESAVLSIKGTKKVMDHDKVLNAPDQITKYFGEFIWNYFRQTLRENEIRYHQLEVIWIDDKTMIKGRRASGPADQVAVEEVNSLLTQLKIPHTYEKKANPIGGSYRVQCELLITNQSVSRSVRSLINKYAEYGVKIGVNETEITIDTLEHGPQIEAIVVTPQPVCMQGKSGTDDDGASDIDTYQHRIKTRGGRPVQEDGIALVETNDLINTIRDSLNDEAQKVYDIVTGRGDTFDDFMTFFRGPRGVNSDAVIEKPRDTHIAKFLKISTRQVKTHMSDIKMQCLAHNVGDS